MAAGLAAAFGLSFLRLLHGAARMNRAARACTPSSLALEEQENHSLHRVGLGGSQTGLYPVMPAKAGIFLFFSEPRRK
ncbi:hypothetical protein [Sphingobium yanoikuyae]|uniref:hypothetical protein n=1 Tax=Sphingobium yanoikuyae TaxID=13690 RepID=UPI00345EEF33